MFNLAIPIQTKIKHFLTCPNISEPLQGWDFYMHAGILDDTKSQDLTGNICFNPRKISKS